MEGSILAQRERVSLGNGMALRLLSALEVLQARREAGELAGEDRERALCSNACLLARALEREEDESPVFSDGRAVLAGLTWRRSAVWPPGGLCSAGRATRG